MLKTAALVNYIKREREEKKNKQIVDTIKNEKETKIGDSLYESTMKA